MRTTIAVMVLAVSLTVAAPPPNMLDTFRQTYEKQQQAALVQYGKTLDSAVAELKKKGDLDGILILQAEKKRFDTDPTVPMPADAKNPVRPAAEWYYQTMVVMLGDYVKAMEGLIKKEVVADRIEEAKVIKLEKDKAVSLLSEMQAKLPVKAGGEKSKTAPVSFPLTTFKPKTYVDETRGATGIGDDHNVYTFNVEQVGQQAKLRFWASGAIGTMTYGKVTLKAPGEEGRPIYSWKPKDFKIPANAVESYKELHPITCDISKLVKTTGSYEVKFKWTDGPVGLHILRVELEIK